MLRWLTTRQTARLRLLTPLLLAVGAVGAFLAVTAQPLPHASNAPLDVTVPVGPTPHMIQPAAGAASETSPQFRTIAVLVSGPLWPAAVALPVYRRAPRSRTSIRQVCDVRQRPPPTGVPA